MKLKIETWLYGLLAAFIGGGANGVVASFAVMGVAPEHFDLNVNLLNTLKIGGTVFLLSGITNVVMLLKKSPLPEIDNGPTP